MFVAAAAAVGAAATATVATLSAQFDDDARTRRRRRGDHLFGGGRLGRTLRDIFNIDPLSAFGPDNATQTEPAYPVSATVRALRTRGGLIRAAGFPELQHNVPNYPVSATVRALRARGGLRAAAEGFPEESLKITAAAGEARGGRRISFLPPVTDLADSALADEAMSSSSESSGDDPDFHGSMDRDDSDDEHVPSRRFSVENVFRFAQYGDDDSDDGCYASDGDLEDEYAFDLKLVAEAVNRGADRAELTQIIEGSMAAHHERRLAEDILDAPGCDGGEDHAPSLAAMADLADAMTPPCSPTRRDSGVTADSEESCTADDGPARKTIAVSTTGASAAYNADGGGEERTVSRARRRSSVAEHPSLLRAIGAANNDFRRQQFAHVTAALECAERLQDECGVGAVLNPRSLLKVRKSLDASCSRRRMSALKAAEVLEAAGVGLHDLGNADSPPGVGSECQQGAVRAQLHTVRRAVDGARRRRRHSMAAAVSEVEKGSDVALAARSPRRSGGRGSSGGA